jgi:hypothetical protein
MVENNSAYDPQSPDQTERSWLGWTARILGTLIAVIWLLVVFVSNLNEPWSDETFILIALVIMSTTDVALAWWRADLGGLALMTTALAHGVFAYLASDHNQGFAIAIRAGPFLIVGLLFIAAWQYSGRRTGI